MENTSTGIFENVGLSPKITVVMPVYNGEKYLNIAINSILNQSFTNFELIIIDDASTDKSVEIINQKGSYAEGRGHL